MANPNQETLDEWLVRHGQLPHPFDTTELPENLPEPIQPTVVPQRPLGPPPIPPRQFEPNWSQANFETITVGPALPPRDIGVKPIRTAPLPPVPQIDTKAVRPHRPAPPPPPPRPHRQAPPPPIDIDALPLNWDRAFTNFEEVGTSISIPWSSAEHFNFYRHILESEGFKLNLADRIYQGDGGEFDHSVWKVYRREGNPDESVEVQYACKIVGLHYYKNKYNNLHIATNALLKEATVLLKLTLM